MPGLLVVGNNDAKDNGFIDYIPTDHKTLYQGLDVKHNAERRKYYSFTHHALENADLLVKLGTHSVPKISGNLPAVLGNIPGITQPYYF